MENIEVSRAPLPKGMAYDDEGNPAFRFPPFPDPPAGVNIIPFKDFKPSGIQISFGGDEVERDGLGIPTVMLPKLHDNESIPMKRKKFITKKFPNGEERRQERIDWWEDWETGEPQRIRSAPTFDTWVTSYFIYQFYS